VVLFPHTPAGDSPAERALKREPERRYAALLWRCDSDSSARYQPKFS